MDNNTGDNAQQGKRKPRFECAYEYGYAKKARRAGRVLQGISTSKKTL